MGYGFSNGERRWKTVGEEAPGEPGAYGMTREILRTRHKGGAHDGSTRGWSLRHLEERGQSTSGMLSARVS